MIILSIKTDNPHAELALYEDKKILNRLEWLADRTLADSIHLKILELLKSVKKDWPDIQGVICFQGPGSFTGLRIGISVANAIAYGLGVPIIGSQNEDWAESGINSMIKGNNNKIVLPFYGSEPHITPQKK